MLDEDGLRRWKRQYEISADRELNPLASAAGSAERHTLGTAGAVSHGCKDAEAVT